MVRLFVATISTSTALSLHVQAIGQYTKPVALSQTELKPPMTIKEAFDAISIISEVLNDSIIIMGKCNYLVDKLD